MIRVFPRLTKWTPRDELAFIGDPPLIRPPNQPVFVSVSFTWDREEGKRLSESWAQYYSDVRLGGPAFGDPGEEFTPGKFIKPGVTITSRGCPNKCPWCFVPEREGNIRELPIKPGTIIQDNNLLACSTDHIFNVFKMLRIQNKPVTFAGGLDGRIFNNWHCELLKQIKIHELWFACDQDSSLKRLGEVSGILGWLPQNKLRCFVMIGYRESIAEARHRLERVYQLGFLPFSQLYRGPEEIHYSDEWHKLNRKWSRPAAYRRNHETGAPKADLGNVEKRPADPIA